MKNAGLFVILFFRRKIFEKSTCFLLAGLFGVGYDGKGKISIGCSYKGRIWSRWVESIEFWMNWCDAIATRILNEQIDTSKILEGALVPVIVQERPASVPYGIEWPIDLDIINDKSFYITNGTNDYPIYETEIKLTQNNESGPIRFSVGNEDVFEEYELRISEGTFGFHTLTSCGLVIKRNKREYKLTEFFNEFPPRIKFVDQSMLEGNIQVKLTTVPEIINKNRFVKWNWDGVDIRKESQGKTKEEGTVQYRLIEVLKNSDKYSIIFDDDDAGEIADVVTFIDGGDKIFIQFYHCKYSHGDKPGARVADLYEVCGQAEKSVKWCQEPMAIIERLISRENSRARTGGTRFEVGNIRKLKEIKNKMRVYPTKVEIAIVQPGIDETLLTEDMMRIISGSASYLLDTYGIELQVICS